MGDDNRTKRLPTAFKILIPLIIISAIAGMYFWKNAAKTPSANMESATSAESAAKGTYVKSFSIASTMGVGIKVDPNAAQKEIAAVE